MEIEEAIEILINEKPHCGKKLTYTEEEKTYAYNIAIKALNIVASVGYEDSDDNAVCDRIRSFLREVRE